MTIQVSVLTVFEARTYGATPRPIRKMPPPALAAGSLPCWRARYGSGASTLRWKKASQPQPMPRSARDENRL